MNDPSKKSFYGNPNPPTPAFSSDYQWIDNYLHIHQLSSPSYRYAYILWFLIALAFIALGLFHSIGGRHTYIGALWTKWTIRRPHLRKKRDHSLAPKKGGHSILQPSTVPGNGQILALALIFIATALLCTLGPDYIAPDAGLFDFTHKATRRAMDIKPYDMIQTSPPTYTIPKAWWTAGGRTGLIAFSLFPFCVLLALKSPPFALFAIKFSAQIYSDKLGWLHRWTGRLIYLVTVAHVVTWVIQLTRDHREGTPNHAIALSYGVVYDKFIFAIIAFVCMTLLVIVSISPLRRENYEVFYFLHVLLVPSTIVFSALHYPPLAWFCYSSLVLWITERAWRWIRLVWVNGMILPPSERPSATHFAADPSHSSRPGWRPVPRDSDSPKGSLEASSPRDFGASAKSPLTPFTDNSPIHKYPPSRPSPNLDIQPYSRIPHSPPPPPGYAYAVLLPGRTIRLTVRTPRNMKWAPGQYALLTIPEISRLTSHPFTISSVCNHDARFPTSDHDHEGVYGATGGELEFIIRARQGFTLDLWERVLQLSTAGSFSQQSSRLPNPRTGRHKAQLPLLRVNVDGPFGSAIRIPWTQHSTVVIVAGGSGVAFGLSVFEYLCLCLSGRDPNALGGRGRGFFGSKKYATETTRIRFVWLVREYSHLLWCSSTIRRCIEMVPSGIIQVDLFVTNFSHDVPRTPRGRHPLQSPPRGAGDSLAPPSPRFASQRRSSSRSSSVDSHESDSAFSSDDSMVDLRYAADHSGKERGRLHPSQRSHEGGDYRGIYSDDEDEEEHDITELTNFDGEDDAAVPGEERFSMRVKRRGRHIRRKTLVATERLQFDRPPQSPPLDSGSVTASVVFPATLGNPPSITSVSSSSAPRKQPLSPLSPKAESTSAQHVPPVATPPAPLHHHQPMRPSRLSAVDSIFSQYTDHTSTGTSTPIHPSHFDPHSPAGFSDFSSLRNLIVTDDNDDFRGPRFDDISDNALDDLSFVASLARPGRPRLDRILAVEADRATGPLAVACCGPISLTGVVRKVVAAQINPAQVWRGDRRGAITFFSEEFSF